MWVREVETGEVRKAFGGDGVAFHAGWSPDGSRLLALDFRSNTDTSVFLVEGESSRELTPHEDEARFLPGPWAPDGSGFYLVTDEGREYLGLAFFRFADGGYEWVETPDWDIEEVALSEDGRVLAWMVNESGWSRLRLRDLETGEDLPEPRLPEGTGPFIGQTSLCVSRDGRHAAVIWAAPQRPVRASS